MKSKLIRNIFLTLISLISFQFTIANAGGGGGDQTPIDVDYNAKCVGQKINISAFHSKTNAGLIFKLSGSIGSQMVYSDVIISYVSDSYRREIETLSKDSNGNSIWKVVENVSKKNGYKPSGIFSLIMLDDDGKYQIVDRSVKCEGLGSKKW